MKHIVVQIEHQKVDTILAKPSGLFIPPITLLLTIFLAALISMLRTGGAKCF